MNVRSTRYLLAACLALAASSCAYYNTFYKAKSYYEKASPDVPYVLDKPDPVQSQNFNKSIDYSKKLIQVYPKSKWVDDAYLLWAKALIGKEDPTLTMEMLAEFSNRFPNSALRDDAQFYLGVAGRKARKYSEALTALDEFLLKNPKHKLAPYAHLEKTRVLAALNRPGEAAQAATVVLEKFPKFPSLDLALAMRADALLAHNDNEGARRDYRALGSRVNSDEERFTYLLKEADALENARAYDQELALLREALAHESEPQLAPVVVQTTVSPTNAPPATTPVNTGPTYLPPTPSVERWGRLMVRIGTVHLLAGRQAEALDAYRRVSTAFAQSPIGSEAQYRIGLAYETVADDFERAREEYGKVARAGAISTYSAQASQRLTNLERLSQLRSGGGVDSVAKQAEASFMRAELYLFQNNKPERSLEEYAAIVRDHPRSPWAGKALTAQAWVLRDKLDRRAEADSLLWVVVRDYPRTEAQLSARDYLETGGHVVPDSLIVPPEITAPADTGRALSSPPTTYDTLGVRRAIGRDSIATLPFIRAGESTPLPSSARERRPGLSAPLPADTLFWGPPLPPPLAPGDTTIRVPSRTTAPPDTARRRP